MSGFAQRRQVNSLESEGSKDRAYTINSIMCVCGEGTEEEAGEGKFPGSVTDGKSDAMLDYLQK